jgi:hypothetical protein
LCEVHRAFYFYCHVCRLASLNSFS